MTSKIVFTILGIMTTEAFAADMKCEITGAVRCPCPASMSVICGTTSGYVDNKEPVRSVAITYRTEDGRKGTVTLTNPKGTARDFYAAKSNDEVVAALRKNHVDPGKAEIEAKSILISSSASIYDDPDKHSLASGTSTSGGDAPKQAACTWVSKPYVIAVAGCGSAICSGTVNCGGAETVAACKAGADGKSCGTAQKCAEDQDVTPVDPLFVTVGDGTTSKGSGAGTAQ
jgi:hypothetical protein